MRKVEHYICEICGTEYKEKAMCEKCEKTQMSFRVWMHGRSMTASYDGYVDVFADDEEDAEYKAKRKLTGPNGTFFD